MYCLYKYSSSRAAAYSNDVKRTRSEIKDKSDEGEKKYIFLNYFLFFLFFIIYTGIFLLYYI